VAQRIGILGGTFDPVHLGHLHAAKNMLHEMKLDKLFLMPSFLPVHRDVPAVSSEQRLAMLSLASKEERKITVDGRELARKGPSFSIFSVEELRAENPDANLYFILGSDAMSQFHSWHRWQEFLDYVNLVVLPRPKSCLTLAQEVSDYFAVKETKDIAEILARKSGSYYQSTKQMLDISATEVRQALVKDESVEDLLDKNVIAYIREHELYRQDLIQ